MIAIDPGHGGSATSDPTQLWDPGVVVGAIMEKDITLDLALRLRILLQRERVKVRTHQARDGQKAFVGRLVTVGENGIELDDETSRKRQTIGFDEMTGANYEYDFDK